MAAGRRSSGVATSKPAKARPKSQKRSHNALAIASEEAPDRLKVRQHRLGESEGGSRNTKRPRQSQDEDTNADSDEPQSKQRRAGKGSTRVGAVDVEEGSDSDGNQWRLNDVGSGDDSDIDSDEALGESDEERFEGFAFRGSSSTKPIGKGKLRHGRLSDLHAQANAQLDLDEGLDNRASTSSDEDDLGDDAVNLATALDASDGQEDMASSVDEEDANEAVSDSLSSLEDDEEPDEAKIATLQRLVASLDPAASSLKSSDGPGRGPLESKKPSDYGLTSTRKLTVADLLPAVTDASLQKSLKLLSSDSTSKPTRKSGGIPGRLQAPLARRQQDRLDRAAAFEKSKETLGRWIDTVKHNRRAEHLSFPLVNPDATAAQARDRLLPTTTSAPVNELEATIQNILETSGLSNSKGSKEEEMIQHSEELQTNKLPLEEVQARRARLRMARELLFREEARAKRIKKIKSKSYRRVHRKQRERSEQETKVALEAAGVDASEDEQEAADRRRAMERMGAKHRESTWARGIKKSGRAAWDVDARMGVTEMARREEDLRKRIEGKPGRTAEDDESDSLSDESCDSLLSDSDDGSSERQKKRLLDHLDKTDQQAGPTSQDGAPGHGISSMRFMQRADATRRAENDAAAKSLRRELVGEGTSSEQEEVNLVGRRKYGQTPIKDTQGAPKSDAKSNEFEERLDSEEEMTDAHSPLFEHRIDNEQGSSQLANDQKQAKSILESRPRKAKANQANGLLGGSTAPKSTFLSSSDRLVGQPDLTEKVAEKAGSESSFESFDEDEKPQSPEAAGSARKQAPAPVNSHLWTSVKFGQAPEVSDSDDSGLEDLGTQATHTQQDLISRAFAGDEVVRDFETEKKRTIEEEDEQVIDNTLPGWGNWTGAGISKKGQRRNHGRFLTKSEGIKADKRQDSKLDRVIINQKRVKKVGRIQRHERVFADKDCRIPSIWRQVCHIPSRRDGSMRDR